MKNAESNNSSKQQPKKDLQKWFVALSEKHRLAAEHFLEMLKEAGLKTVTHAFKDREKSKTFLFKFLKEGRLEATEQSIALATQQKLKENLELAFLFVEKSLERIEKQKRDISSMEKFREGLKEVVDKFCFGDPKNHSTRFYHLNPELDPKHFVRHH